MAIIKSGSWETSIPRISARSRTSQSWHQRCFVRNDVWSWQWPVLDIPLLFSGTTIPVTTQHPNDSIWSCVLQETFCGLVNIGILHLFCNDFDTEDDIDTFQRKIVEPWLEEVREEQQVFDHVAEPNILSTSSFSLSPILTCLTQFDEFKN